LTVVMAEMITGRAVAWLSGFSARTVMATSLVATSQVSEGRCWLYEMEWTRMGPLHLSEVHSSRGGKLLVLGSGALMPLVQPSGAMIERIGTNQEVKPWHAVALTTALLPHKSAGAVEMQAVDAALRLLQAQVVCEARLPVWLCTTATQLISHAGGHTHAGLWGLARSCRQEDATQPAWCLDLSDVAPAVEMVPDNGRSNAWGATTPYFATSSHIPLTLLSLSSRCAVALLCSCDTEVYGG
jgi:hypothetical protein